MVTLGELLWSTDERNAFFVLFICWMTTGHTLAGLRHWALTMETRATQYVPPPGGDRTRGPFIMLGSYLH